MAEQAKRLSALPGRSGVGREPLVEQCERDCEGRIAQVGVELGELVGGAQCLVRDRSEGQGADVRARGSLYAFTGSPGASLSLFDGHPERAAEHELLDPGCACDRTVAKGKRLDGHGPPSEGLDALGRACLFDSMACRVVA